MTTREQIEALMAGTEGVTPGPWKLSAEWSNYWNEVFSLGTTSPKTREEADRYRRNAEHLNRCSPEVIRDLCALALKALDAGSATGVMVKALEWKTRNSTSTPFGTYDIGKYGKYWAVYFNGDLVAEPQTEEAAKAAAQADYEQRILSTLARPASPEVKPVAWRASINPFGQPGFRYAETEQELIRGGLHKREPLYASPPADSGGLRDDRDSQQRVAIRLLSAVMAAQDVLDEWIVSGISDYECLNRLLSILDDQDFVRFERSLVNLRAALKGEPNAR